MAIRLNSSTPPITRLAYPLAFAAFLRHIGAPVERHLRRQGLPTLCNDPNQFVPLHRAWSFFDATARQEDIMLGWHVGRFVGLQKLNYNFIRRLENASTLYQSLHQMVRLIRSEASHLQIGILERGQDILLYTHYAGQREVPGYMTSQAYQLEAYISLMRYYIGEHWVPPEIGIEYPSVPPIMESHFPGARILVGQKIGYITVPRSCLHTTCPASTGAVREDDFSLTKLEYIDTLRALLRSYLADGYLSERFAASLMDTSERTLTRRLSDHGRTYGSLVDEVCFNTAKELLQTPGMKIVDVARSVGFEDHSDFTRMFRRIGGLTPRKFRAESNC